MGPCEAALGALRSGRLSSEIALQRAKRMEKPLVKMDQELLSVLWLG